MRQKIVFNMRLQNKLLVVFFVSIVTACAGTGFQALDGVAAPQGQMTPQQNLAESLTPTILPDAKRPLAHRVEKGDTLYSISWKYQLDLKAFAAANGLVEPYTIYPGQVLALKELSSPAVQVSVQETESPQQERTESEKVQNAEVVVNQPIANVQKIDDQATDTPRHYEWIWPIKGKIVRAYSPGLSGNSGIDIEGSMGESVLAAANGKVVYAGNGLRGYGNLIIIEHSPSTMSAYAYNREILVSEKQDVKQGEKIALIGSKDDIPLLHFEIRVDGSPVDPKRFLP